MAAFAQQVIWTALPDDVARGELRVSVTVSPRLTVADAAAAELSRFPAWLDWPKTVSASRFTVVFDGRELEARVVSKPESRTWKAIFTRDTLVLGHAFQDLSGRPLIAYPMAALQQRLRDLVVEVARDRSDSLPDGEYLHDRLQDLARAPSGTALLEDLVGPGGDKYLQELRGVGQADLALFHAYHAPFTEKPGKKPDRATARSLEKAMDFHRLVAALGQYRRLLRETGLVVDLMVDAGSNPVKGPLSVRVDWPAGRGVDTRPDGAPEVMAQFDGKTFEALARGRHITGRRLDLGDARYAPVQLDIDGGIIKLTGTGVSMAARRVNESLSGDLARKDTEPTGLPTLRSTGIVMAEAGRAESLAARLADAAGFEQALCKRGPIRLYAEDVTRGYHVDVEVDRRWHSLCRTTVSYAMTNDGLVLSEKDVEGIVQLGVTEPPPGAPAALNRVMRFSEGLFHWDGWSLAAPRPGLALSPAGEPQRPGMQASGLPVHAEIKALPGSLPRLRFGATYRMRMRLVDLAHNAESWAAQDAAGASAKITYRRFEPVAPPAAALVRSGKTVDKPSHGASLLRMVIRSGAGEEDSPTPDVDLRMLFPPRSSVEMAERHGVLDGRGGRPRADLYALIAGRDADLDEVQAGDPEDKLTYPVADQGATTAPWLPDPAAARARVTLARCRPRLGGAGGPTLSDGFRKEIPSGADWPDQRPWMLRLHQDPDDLPLFLANQWDSLDLAGRVRWDDRRRMLSVSLPKAEIVRVSLSHMLEGEAELSSLWGIAAWLKEELSGDAYHGIASRIRDGDHWAFTPALEIELVHATQRPLVRPHPVMNSMPGRLPGNTGAEVVLSSVCHPESTAELMLEGRWIEPRDNGGAEPLAEWGGATAVRWPLDDAQQGPGELTLSGRHRFGDTRYRRVRYRLRGTSRFAEYFAPEIRDDPKRNSLVSAEVVTHVRNAAPPPPPKVVRSVPVFERLRGETDVWRAVWRRAGLRVYLERPWFETGFGEMLAAVLPAGMGAQPAEVDAGTAPETYWAGDPIWTPHGDAGKVTSAAPDMAAFPTRARSDDGPDERWPDSFPMAERDLSGGYPSYTGLSLPDENGQAIMTVDAAGHPVSWDPEQGLYYADLMMRTGRVYQPFVSLSVARLHPVSLDGCHLSPALRLEPQQVLPERLIIASLNPETGWLIRVFGHLHDQADFGAEDLPDRPRRNVIRVEVQRAACPEPKATTNGDEVGTEPDELDWETVEDGISADPPHLKVIDPSSAFTVPAAFTAAKLFPGKEGALREAVQAFIEEQPTRLYSRRFRVPGAGGTERPSLGDRPVHLWRIRVTEWERHVSDSGVGPLDQTPGDNERLVFAETIEV